MRQIFVDVAKSLLKEKLPGRAIAALRNARFLGFPWQTIENDGTWKRLQSRPDFRELRVIGEEP